MPAKLYKLDASPPARAAMMARDIFNVDVEMIDVDLMKGDHMTPDYLKMNPLHTVPVFVDGDLVIHESHALLIYFAEVYGKGSLLYSEDSQERALINQKLFFNDGVLFPRLRNVTYPAFVEGVKGVSKEQLQKIQEAYDFMEEFLTRHKFLALDHITIADIAAFTTVGTFPYILPLDSAKYPRLAAWLKEMEKQPYCQKHNSKGAKLLGEFMQSATAFK